MDVCSCPHTSMHALNYLYTDIHACLSNVYIYLHIYMQICMHTPACLATHIHTYIDLCIHTYAYIH